MTPRHSIDFCPICGGGLCGIRIVGDDSAANDDGAQLKNSPLSEAMPPPHGLIICDECEAIWLEPDVSTVHQYPDLENAVSPISGQPIWGRGSRWATMEDIETLGWTEAVNPELDAEVDSDLGSDEKFV
jgi:hypothetical protein